MKKISRLLPLFLVVGAMLMSGCAVVAEAPNGGSMGRDGGRNERPDDRRDDDRRGRDDDRRGSGSVQVQIGGYFGERQRADVYAYYGQPPRAHCPPGLAKKGNGCQPPGQAKKWKLGQPLPRDISYRPVEADIRIRLGTPPTGHEFVRVAQDILLIAVGTSIVIDAIEDLQR
ncbi:MAG: hypothetical protein ACK4F4_02590 [Hylemonella sp.]|uniref:hypothetical protein n=1 Tax=Hylemonella sp. TaxID=2066020 RepID=UPI003918BDC9